MTKASAMFKDILRFRLENTKYVVLYIKNDIELHEKCKKAGAKKIKKVCWRHAEKNNEEFGNRFILELHDVFWDKVWRNIR